MLPLTARLKEAFAARYLDFPDDTRRILLLAALAGTNQLTLLFGGEITEADLQSLEPAEQGRLVRIDVRRASLAFTHPLIRASIADSASPAQVRSAQLALAKLEAADQDRRAWHLAAASIAPDETVAAMLEETAHRNLRRGDPSSAVNAMLRAAELSPDKRSRSSRLAKAAHIAANVTGDLRSVSELLREAKGAEPEPSESLYATATAAMMLVNGEGDVATAHRMLTEAIRIHGGEFQQSDEALIAALFTLNFVCYLGGAAGLWREYETFVARLSPQPPLELHLLTTAFADPAHCDAGTVDLLADAVASLDEADHWRTAKIAAAAVYLDRLSGCRSALVELVRRGRQGEVITLAITAFNFLGPRLHPQWRLGQGPKLVPRGTGTGEAVRRPRARVPLHGHLGVIAALRGNKAEMTTAIDAITRWGTPRRAWSVLAVAEHIRTLAHMSSGDYEQAYQAACSLSSPGTLQPYSPFALYVCMDLVESAVHVGKMDEARAHVAAIQQAEIGGLSSRLRLLTRGAGALVASNADARQLFEQALTGSDPESRQWPFDRARVQLNYGEHLRRSHGSTRKARHQLTEALEVFTRLKAEPWRQRATAELRAAGSHAQEAPSKKAGSLTPQEYEIATLGAAGLTNKEIAKRIFLSDRTVGAHLYRTFPKLGITTRAGLRDALNAQAAPAE